MTDAARVRECTDQAVSAALIDLDTAPTRVPASACRELEGLGSPGLYSWWVDPAGLIQLEAGLGLPIGRDRIYAGQTGATKWPSGRAGAMTLGQRLSGNHLGGSISASTFRRTLASCLFEPLELELIGAAKLSRDSERALSAWMRRHLSVAIHPFDGRDALSDLERRVLAVLDPPLNLEGMLKTPVRVRLSELRTRVSRPADAATAGQSRKRSHVASSPPPRPPTSGQATLHEEILEILQMAQAPMTTAEIAAAVNERGIYRKRDGSTVTAFQIYGRTRNYPHLFERDGQLVIARPS